MNMDLTGKIAVITGASKGIGKSIALEFARAGAILALNYRNDDKGMEDVINEIRSMGGYAEKFKTDVSIYEDVLKMFEDIENKFGKIDILVNNAGISKVGLFIDMNEDQMKEIVDINLMGTINCCHAVSKYMLKRKSGAIINISSMWGNCGASCEVLYSATKGGINAFTKALGKELGPSGIRVNAIAPGVINTSMNSFLNEDERNELVSEIPLSRFGEGEEVAKLAIFLAHENSSYITSQIVNIDGGIL